LPARFGNLGYRRRVTEPIDPEPPAPDVGRLVGGRYRLAGVIGTGGMATVHRALDTKLDRPVAVKLLRREAIADADIAMRFRREALAATVLRHPNIVPCLETGTDDDQPFIVMELIEGEDLAARLRRVGRLAPAEAARIGLDVARALGVAHIRGIVHRDVKPGNILLARDGRAMVADFGIARLAADTEGAVPGTTLGSVHYFSPEQAKGETTTAASDVYSLGLVLFESLTGQRAWRGETTASLATVRIGAQAPSPRALRPEIPAALADIIVRALDPDPARRFPNGNALALALEPVVSWPDPSNPTVATDAAAFVAGAAAVAAGAAGAAGGGGIAPPMRPAAVSPPIPRAPIGVVRRASPAIAGPLAVLLAVAAVVVGALFVASRPGRGDAAGIVVASPSRTPVRTPVATPRPTTIATPTAALTQAPDPTVKPRAGAAANLCDPILGFACRLDAGSYEPTRFSPPIGFTLGDGWSTSLWASDIIVLGRPEGNLTLAGAIKSIYPSGDAADPPRSARALVETFIGTDGVAAGRPADGRIDKRKATIVDLAPAVPDPVALFGTSAQTYYLEPSGTTRIMAIDGKAGIFVIAIEPTDRSTLDAFLKAADPVVKSLRLR
jgi:tRNA A-37 threonylcarbamoyl transferase component Bud32